MLYTTSIDWDLKAKVISSSHVVNMGFIKHFLHLEQLDKNKFGRLRKVLHYIYKLGVVDGEQLYQLFDCDKSERKFLSRHNLIVGHTVAIKLDKQRLVKTIYTLHQDCFHILTDLPRLPNNYWLAYDKDDYLKALASTDFYIKFKNQFPTAKVLSDVAPFSYKLVLGNGVFHVYCMRGKTIDLTEYIRIAQKYKEKDKRVLILVERVNYLDPILSDINKTNLLLRIVEESTLIESESVMEAFYRIENGQIVKENAKVVKTS